MDVSSVFLPAESGYRHASDLSLECDRLTLSDGLVGHARDEPWRCRRLARYNTS